MNGNTFEVTGKVNYIKLDYGKNGGAFCRVLVSKKIKDNDYITLPIMLFGDVAEQCGKAIDKGDTANFKGAVGVNKYKDEERIELKAFEFTKVVYDESKRMYVPAEGTEAKQGELPWG